MWRCWKCALQLEGGNKSGSWGGNTGLQEGTVMWPGWADWFRARGWTLAMKGAQCSARRSPSADEELESAFLFQSPGPASHGLKENKGAARVWTQTGHGFSCETAARRQGGHLHALYPGLVCAPWWHRSGDGDTCYSRFLSCSPLLPEGGMQTCTKEWQLNLQAPSCQTAQGVI